MGNICNSNEKDCKDADSEFSESVDNTCPKNEAQKQVHEEKQEKDPQNVTNTSATEKTVDFGNESSEANQTPSEEVEKINKINITIKPSESTISTKEIERNKKIVIYVVTSDKQDFENKLKIVCKLCPNILTYCRVKEFELTASFTHHVKNKIINLSQNASNNYLHTALKEIENCLSEFERHNHSYIIPVIFLGSTLDTPHIPKKIEKVDFDSLLSDATKEQSDILHKFYKLDNQNQTDVYSLVEESFKVDESENILKTFITLMPTNLKDIYLCTPTEEIINKAILKMKELSKRCIWIQSDNNIKISNDDQLIQTEISRRLSNLQKNLKDEILLKNTMRTFSSFGENEDLYSELEAAVKSNIDSIISEHSVKYRPLRNTLGMCKQVVADIAAAKRHCIAFATNSANSNAMEAVSRYIRSDSLFPFAVFGKCGAGKTTLSSEITMNMDQSLGNCHFILRYALLTVVSSEISSLMASITEEISLLIKSTPCRTKHDILEYKKHIEDLLESSEMTFIIIIDSVEKILGVTDLSWLPNIKNSKSKIIITITTNSEDIHENHFAIELLKAGIPKEHLISLDDHGKNSFQSKVISHLSMFGVNDVNNSNDTDALVEKLFSTLESEIDAKFLEILLIILAISYNGIYETDCINILEEQAQLDKVYSLTLWSKFCWIMGPMLLHTDKIQIMDNAFKEAILKRYSKNILEIQTITKRYYENQPDSFHDLEKNLYRTNEEKYSKLPHLDLAIYEIEKTVPERYFESHYFKDLSWMVNKISCTGCFQYLYDILSGEYRAKNVSKDFQHITILKQFLSLHMTQLNCDGSQFYTLFKLFIKNLILNDKTLANNNYIKDWTATMDNLKEKYLDCLNSDRDNVQEETVDDVVSLKAPGYLVAAMSTNSDEICVWDVPNCKIIRKLKGVPQPSLLSSISDLEAAVLCKREIRVIDLDAGQYKATLKGVMNQKVPYFGLHDDNHLVCLSRNRMYVNLMNLKTGDCTTSFKAGEDRFLNSLIVSGNGRILVCGDESQKPFSLLVWHLSQRRLLYDLRIPHHDLFTSLSAITYEGLYVSVVAKEIREPGPNFIVVYDLQSGTLFQKLKPVYNTVAIAISQANGCVIAGLENAEILIWDLVTGNCRHTLIGHSAPVTFMKLDPLGSCLLSGDKEGKDLSLRLWELSTGNSLAVYSPPQKTTACEILDNGVFVILAIKDSPGLSILCLRNYEKTQMQSEKPKNEINDCKIYTLSEN